MYHHFSRIYVSSLTTAVSYVYIATLLVLGIVYDLRYGTCYKY